MKTIDLDPLPSFLERQRLPIQPRPATDLDDQPEADDPPASHRAIVGVMVLLALAVALLALAMVAGKGK